VTFLVEKGKAEVDKADNDGRTPLLFPSKEGNLEVVKYLVEVGKVDMDKAMND